MEERKNTGSIAEQTGLEGKHRKVFRDISNLVAQGEARYKDGQAIGIAANPAPQEVQIALIDTRGLRAIRFTAIAQNADGRIRITAIHGNANGTIGSWAVPRQPPPVDEGVSVLIEYPGPLLRLEVVVAGPAAPATQIWCSWHCYPFDVLEDPSA